MRAQAHRISLLRSLAAAPGSQTPTAADALRQTIELAVAAEEIGIDGAFVRVHHFAPQLASPFPLLAAIAARTRRIEMGTAVIDMRYENPLYMAEEAAATDLIGGGRLQLGISRGSPEPALRGAESFGYVPPEGQTDADLARMHTQVFRAAIEGAGVAQADPAMTGASGRCRSSPSPPGSPSGSGGARVPGRRPRWTAEQGMNLMSSTLLTEDTGVPFDELQAEQIAIYRAAWAQAGWDREPRVSVSRSVLPIVTDATGATSAVATRARTRSATWTAAAGSGAATSASRTSSPRELSARRRRAGRRHASC